MANKLKRFLILGSADYVYVASHTHKIPATFLELSGFDNLVENAKEEEIVEALVEAAAAVKIGLTDPLMLAHATSLCMKSGTSKLRTLIYKEFTSICLTSESLFTLLKTTHELNKTSPKHLGLWGKGFRKAVTRWYTLRITEGDPHFAAIFISENACHGWSHVDVLKLIHFRAPTPSTNAIIKYFAFGKLEALSELSPEVQRLAKKSEELKKSMDGARVAALLRDLKMQPYSMPARFHKNTEVWLAYIHNLPMGQVLKRLEFLTSCKKLKSSDICFRLEKADIEDLDAAQVMMYLAKYRALYRSAQKSRAIKRKLDEAAVQEASGFSEELKNEKRKSAPKPTVVDPCVASIVSSLVDSCLGKISTDNLTWTFLFHSENKKDSKCSYPCYLTVSEAATFSMKYLNRTGEVFYFAKDEIHPYPANPSLLINDFPSKKLVIDSGTPFLHPNTDVVVLVMDTSNESRVKQLQEKINEAVTKPEMRLVIMLLTANKSPQRGDKTLVICGFDERTLRLMHSFAKGVF